MSKSKELFLASAESQEKLEQVLVQYENQYKNDSTTNLREFCLQSAMQSGCGKYRTYQVLSNLEELKISLEEGDVWIQDGKKKGTKNVFLIPGNGIYQKGMITILKNVHPMMDKWLSEYEDICIKITGFTLDDEDGDDFLIQQTKIVLSEICIARFWMYLGLQPDYLIAHSLGEYATAVIANVMTIEDCITMLKIRGEILREEMGQCRMAAVYESFDRIAPYLNEDISIAAYNAPDLCTLSGDEKAMEDLLLKLQEQNISCHSLTVKGGGHSKKLESQVERFLKATEHIKFGLPTIPIISTVDGGIATENIATNEYWARHLVQPVLFMQAFEHLDDSVGTIVDVGVSPALLNMAMMNYPHTDVSFIPSIKGGRNYRTQLLKASGLLFVNGKTIDWRKLY